MPLDRDTVAQTVQSNVANSDNQPTTADTGVTQPGQGPDVQLPLRFDSETCRRQPIVDGELDLLRSSGGHLADPGRVQRLL
jgi:hypothetical protein